MNEKISCYLCGEGIHPDVLTREHVPPAQFFPKKARKFNNLQLMTLPARNTDYSKDEEYFRTSVGVIANDRPIGKELFIEIQKQLNRGEAKGLRKRILGEFSSTISDRIHLPPRTMLKSIDSKRMYRVAWKIFRGAYFYDNGRFLNEDLDRRIWLVSETIPDQQHLEPLRKLAVSQPERGRYPGAFAYKYGESTPPGIVTFALLFWDQVMFIGLFHHSDCPCTDCSSKHT
jgi:hypothetical protein